MNCPQLQRRDTVVALATDDADRVSWSAMPDPAYPSYYRAMKAWQARLPSLDISKTVIFSTLRQCVVLGGHSSTIKARLEASGDVFVFKGIDLACYLQNHDEDDEADETSFMFDSWAMELAALSRLPSHPDVQLPPSIFVTIPADPAAHNPNDQNVICGHLTPSIAGGDLSSPIEAGTPTALSRKAKWCYQMSSAIKPAHAHGEYHKDIKPANMLITDNDNLLLIDLEQTLAPALTIAPEADGTWDVEINHSNSIPPARSTLRYIKYTGPPRRNNPTGFGINPWAVWNVFPIWQKECPLALELAEVFSLGRTM